jgi:hypothetical protein
MGENFEFLVRNIDGQPVFYRRPIGSNDNWEALNQMPDDFLMLITETHLMKDGGVVCCKSHTQGGEKFNVGGRVYELEGEEGVINKRSMRDKNVYTVTGTPKQIASKINEIGGGVKFEEGAKIEKTSDKMQDGGQITDNTLKINENCIFSISDDKKYLMKNYKYNGEDKQVKIARIFKYIHYNEDVYHYVKISELTPIDKNCITWEQPNDEELKNPRLYLKKIESVLKIDMDYNESLTTRSYYLNRTPDTRSIRISDHTKFGMNESSIYIFIRSNWTLTKKNDYFNSIIFYYKYIFPFINPNIIQNGWQITDTKQTEKLKLLFEDLYNDHYKAYDCTKEIYGECENCKDVKSQAERIVKMWEDELEHHFAEEEKDLFPALKGKDSETDKQIDELLEEHEYIKNLVSQINKDKSNKELVSGFCKILQGHIVKEEKVMEKFYPKDIEELKLITDNKLSKFVYFINTMLNINR